MAQNRPDREPLINDPEMEVMWIDFTEAFENALRFDKDLVAIYA
jgi:hypothetical protein